MPNINDLKNKRIAVLSSIVVYIGGNNESVLRWCQRIVKYIIDGAKDPTVNMKWDGCADIKGWEQGGESHQRLMPGLWNKDRVGSWRLDMDIIPCPDEAEDDISDNSEWYSSNEENYGNIPENDDIDRTIKDGIADSDNDMSSDSESESESDRDYNN